MRASEIYELISTPAAVKKFKSSEFGDTKDPFYTTDKDQWNRGGGWKDQVSAFVEQNNLKVIGNGTFGVVVEKPGYPFLIKLFSDADKAYLDWIAFCNANKSNKFLPKFKGKVGRAAKRLLYVRLEKLTHAPNDEPADALNQMIGEYDAGMPMSRISQWFPDYHNDDELELVLKKLISISDGKFKSRIGVDISGDNVMMRGSTVVITDPAYMTDYR